MKTSRQWAWAAIGAVAAAMLSTPASAQRVERSGAEVVDAVCVTCHAKGEKGAPKIGDKRAWSKRTAQGLQSLTANALQGIRNMPSHGGNMQVSNIEIERAIINMVNRSGGNWIEPLGVATPAQLRTSEQIVQTACSKCHQDGTGGAPKIGDRAAWTPRVSKGLDNLVKSAVHGHGAMPARGGVSDLSDVELQGAIVYMFNYGIPMAKTPPPAPTPANPYYKLVDGSDVYLGVMRAQAMAAGQPKGSVPSGKDYYHVNISLFDAKSKLPITDAQIKVKVADTFSTDTKTLEVESANNTISYGAYFKMSGTNPYAITAQIQRAGTGPTSEVKFEYKPR